MNTVMKPLILGSVLLISACTTPQSATHSSCEPLGLGAPELSALKANDFDVKRPGAMAVALVDCLGDPDQNTRDGIAYEAITHWLRGAELTDPEVRELKVALLAAVDTPDKEGFRAPFAALVLSEVARFDRETAFMTAEERSGFVAEAAKYMSNVEDYRGYDDAEGWRHGVAHGADWLMQLSLIPNVSDTDLIILRDTVASQIMPSGHAYIHGESERLARPIVFVARHGTIAKDDWTEWFTRLADPAPFGNWGQAYRSEEGLARLHNLKGFLNVIYVNASTSTSENVKALLPGATAALQSLP